MKKTLSLALAVLTLTLGMAGAALAATSAPAALTSQDKAYLESIQCDPNADWITGLKPAQCRALHNLINKNTDPDTKKAAVNKFLDDAVAQYLLSLGNSSSDQA